MSDSGQVYGGRYRVLEAIGSGGMAEVYRARDELLGRDVAVKVLTERFASDRSFVERFRREAQAAANLNHPNIVALYDYGSEGNSYYIVMEFIEGRSLADVLSEYAPLLPERAADIASEVAAALERAHGAGIVHRDIKPGNVMVTSSGQVKVTDFGIARAVGGDQTMTQTGMVIGTASYLSPEQAQGDTVDARSDVYSLGIVLYEMLAGKLPFSGDTPLAIAYKHVREDPKRLGSINPDVPASLDAIVMKAMSKNPDNRYHHAGEMKADLDRFRKGQRVLATPVLEDATTVAAPLGGTAVMSSTEILADEPERRGAGRYVGIALAALLVIGLLAFFVANALLSGEKVEVPQVTGMTEDEARAALDEAGLSVEVERRPNKAELGQVFRQEPKPGEEIDEGDPVTIFVSLGPKEVEVPGLVGLDIRDARQELRDLGLKVNVTREPHDEAEEGEVTAQSIQPGIEVEVGTEVTLTVSTGPETIVPNVIGFTEEDAIAAIEEEGLNVVVTRAASDQEEGIVFDQDPQGGTEAEPGDTVTIVVSEGAGQAMPNVVGEDADQAEDFLEEDFGLDVTLVDEEEEPCFEPPGRVCRQSPEPGTEVSPGDEAILYVQPGDSSLDPGAFFAFLFGSWLA